jgi:hypothetical protein
MMIGSYEHWKWNSLRQRRLVFFQLLNWILIFTWSTIYFDFPPTIQDATRTKGKSPVNGQGLTLLSVVKGVGAFFFYAHCLLGAFTQFTRLGKIIMERHLQGLRFSNFNTFSVVISMVFLLVPVFEFDNIPDSTTIFLFERIAVFAAVSAVGITICHHLGLSQR